MLVVFETPAQIFAAATSLLRQARVRARPQGGALLQVPTLRHAHPQREHHPQQPLHVARQPHVVLGAHMHGTAPMRPLRRQTEARDYLHRSRSPSQRAIRNRAMLRYRQGLPPSQAL